MVYDTCTIVLHGAMGYSIEEQQDKWAAITVTYITLED